MVALAVVVSTLVNIAAAWLDQSLDAYKFWEAWAPREAKKLRIAILAAHGAVGLAVAAILAFGPRWPEVNSWPAVLVAIAIWVPSAQSLLRAQWAPADLSQAEKLRSLLSAIVRRSRSSLDAAFAARFRTIVAVGSSVGAVAAVVERTQEAVASSSGPADEQVTLGLLSDVLARMQANPTDVRSRAEAIRQIRIAIWSHRLLPTVI